ncbi:MAG: penicillin-binding protein 2 [Candidatus Competibacteraceae bacterium]
MRIPSYICFYISSYISSYRLADLRRLTRHQVVLGLLLLAAGGIFARAIYLQLINKDFLQEQGNERYLRTVAIPAHRGMVLDRNGEPLAVSSPVDSIWVVPELLLANPDRLPLLAQTLGMKAGELERRLSDHEEREFFYLRRHLTPDLAQRVLNLQIPGVYSQREYRRYYPTAEITSHLLGFTDIDDAGQEGLELGMNERLQGVPGSKRVIRDRLGHIVEDVEVLRVPEPGKPLTLSIDRRVQYVAYRALKEAVLERQASGASAVVLDVATGEILAMVNQPAGNPNDRRQLNAALLRNRAVTDIFEPGSTMKPFTAALALESGAYRPETPIDTSPGVLQVGRYTVKDVHNYGRIDVTRVISKSSNVGISKIALSMPAQKLWDLYHRLGFGTLSGLGFAGEQAGLLKPYSTWGAIGHANNAFGYGISVNILQLAQAYAVLASGGVRRPLSLLRRDKPPEEEVRLLSEDTTRKIRAMLELAVSEAGTGAKATVPGYRVAGKTGTVHKTAHGRYSPDRYRSLFAGMVPASRPRLVCVVVIDEPHRGGYYGGAIAAPVFSQIMEATLRILNVPPDAIPSQNLVVVGKAEKGTAAETAQ